MEEAGKAQGYKLTCSVKVFGYPPIWELHGARSRTFSRYNEVMVLPNGRSLGRRRSLDFVLGLELGPTSILDRSHACVWG